MHKKLISKKSMKELISEETKVINAYRYLSWALTSVVYLIGEPYSVIYIKLGVIISLLLSSKVTADLYTRFKENKGIIRTLVLIETLGITLLLLPTGGLSSPFIWYALNPTIVAASYLTTYFCWINLLFYFVTGSIMSYVLFNPSRLSMMKMLLENSNLALVFILITLAVQLLAGLTKKLSAQTQALHLSNKEKQEAMDHMMSLYQMIEALNNHCSKEKLFEELAIYTAKLTKSSLSFFWLPSGEEDKIQASVELSVIEEEKLRLELQKFDIKWEERQEIKNVIIDTTEFLMMPILSPTTYFGLVVTQNRQYINPEDRIQNVKLLEFISKLCAVTLERFNEEDTEDHLLVMEEQNRIANELHDSVSQRLFSISYAVHGLLGKWKDVSRNELKEYLVEIKESSNISMEELRNSIYKLSSSKKGEKSLEVSLRGFLDSIARLHLITIDFDIKGNENFMTLSLKRAITRIIREACGNAVRHGKCKKIQVALVLESEFICLSINDDGKGFIVQEQESKVHAGLGISNMKSLVSSFYGKMKVRSQLGEGTEILITIPGKGFEDLIHQEEEVVI